MTYSINNMSLHLRKKIICVQRNIKYIRVYNAKVAFETRAQVTYANFTQHIFFSKLLAISHANVLVILQIDILLYLKSNIFRNKKYCFLTMNNFIHVIYLL